MIKTNVIVVKIWISNALVVTKVDAIHAIKDILQIHKVYVNYVKLRYKIVLNA